MFWYASTKNIGFFALCWDSPSRVNICDQQSLMGKHNIVVCNCFFFDQKCLRACWEMVCLKGCGGADGLKMERLSWLLLITVLVHTPVIIHSGWKSPWLCSSINSSFVLICFSEQQKKTFNISVYSSVWKENKCRLFPKSSDSQMFLLRKKEKRSMKNETSVSSSFTHPHVVSDLSDFIWKTKHVGVFVHGIKDAIWVPSTFCFTE